MPEEQILLVDDDSVLASELSVLFSELGLRIFHAPDGLTGLTAANNGNYSAILLDVRMGGMNGFDVCREIRKTNERVPIIFLTSRGSETDRILGFELGANDFLTKPFNPNELIARVRAILRFVRAFEESAQNEKITRNTLPLVVSDLEVDPQRRTVNKKGQAITLTVKEFDLLLYLLQRPGRVFSKLDLLRSVWGLDYAGYEDSVVSMVRRIRSKIEDDSEHPFYLRTSYGAGYYFVDYTIFPDAEGSSDGKPR